MLNFIKLISIKILLRDITFGVKLVGVNMSHDPLTPTSLTNELKVKFYDHPFMLVLVCGDRGSNVIPTKIPN
jgi:hypothetical protein